MAKLEVMPHEGIINGFKGVVDFYYWMGIPVARRWPRSPQAPRSEPVRAQWPAWTTAAREWLHLSPYVQEAYNSLSVGTGMCGRDLQVKGYISGLYRYPH